MLGYKHMPEALLAGLFGLLIGSFLNVCIHRWPRDLSVVRPRSKCPVCDEPIVWYDNIPLLSWFALRGHCRRCRAPIHWRYPLVELLTALSFAYFVFQLGPAPAAARDCVFAAILIALVFSDLETLLLPDELTLGGLAVGLLFSLFVPVPDSTFHVISGLFGFHPAEAGGSFGEAALGAFVPAAAIWLAGWLFEKLRHKEGLGFGDVKMLAMIGAFLGLRGALTTIILGSLFGSVLGLAFIKLTGRNAATYQLPFGAFLGAAAFVTAIEGQRLISWYAHTVL
jgi:leader peptidase (prepilin peptidase)/N-methyltransferase